MSPMLSGQNIDKFHGIFERYHQILAVVTILKYKNNSNIFDQSNQLLNRSKKNKIVEKRMCLYK